MPTAVDVDIHGMPYAIPPMLAVPGELPTGPHWALEWKWDGLRCCYRVAPNGATLLTSRNGNDFTPFFPDLVDGPFVEALHGREAVFDGEIVVLHDGVPDFGYVQIRHQRRPSPRCSRRTQPRSSPSTC